MIKRKNIMYFSATIREESIEIRHATGNIYVLLLLKSNIEDKINKIRSSDGSNIGYIDIGGVQIMIKAHFREGINSLVNIVVLDNRIKHRKDDLLGIKS